MPRSSLAFLALAALALLAGCRKAPLPLSSPHAPTIQASASSTLDADGKAVSTVGADPATAGVAPEADFVAAAEASDAYEVAAGRFVAAQAADPQVQHLAADTAKAYADDADQLGVIVPETGLDLPASAAMDARHREMLEILAASRGPAFERVYLDQQGSDQNDSAAVFRAYAEHGTNPQLKAYAARALPDIEHHLDMAHKIEAALK
jgi:putative membrane protein